MVLVLDGGHPEGDRPLLADLHLLGVQTGGALLDAAGPRQGAGRDEQGLGQGGLPRARVADERHVAHFVGGAGAGAVAVSFAMTTAPQLREGPGRTTAGVPPGRTARCARRAPPHR